MKLPEYKIELKPLSVEASKMMGFKWAGSEIGKRSKLGGAPDYLQPHHTPTCDACGEQMSFLCQLDSVGDDIVFADVGMVYVFICFDCFEVKAFVQSG
ncbi:hypothetical protein [Ruegeria sp.]|uniref:hypothetical protein n=1 Tax=Ruegeria sp. TaxID=1879320 RepID=UPI003C7E0946